MSKVVNELKTFFQDIKDKESKYNIEIYDLKKQRLEEFWPKWFSTHPFVKKVTCNCEYESDDEGGSYRYVHWSYDIVINGEHHYVHNEDEVPQDENTGKEFNFKELENVVQLQDTLYELKDFFEDEDYIYSPFFDPEFKSEIIYYG